MFALRVPRLACLAGRVALARRPITHSRRLLPAVAAAAPASPMTHSRWFHARPLLLASQPDQGSTVNDKKAKEEPATSQTNANANADGEKHERQESESENGQQQQEQQQEQQQQKQKSVFDEAFGDGATPPPSSKGPNWAFISVLTGFAGGLIIYLGMPDPDNNDEKYKDSNIVSAYVGRAIDKVKGFYSHYSDPSAKKLLPEPLPEMYRRPYTLVLELEDTLVHSEWTPQHGWRTAKRPFLNAFLAKMVNNYEIIIYTSQLMQYAQPIIIKADSDQTIMYCLYRDSTKYVDGDHVKDLDSLNRDPRTVVVVDRKASGFKLHPHNGIQIKPWTGDPNDRELLDLMVFLDVLATTGVDDVREVLKGYDGKEVLPTFNENRRRFAEEQQRQIALRRQAQSAPAPAKIPQLDQVAPQNDASQQTWWQWITGQPASKV